MAQNSEHDSMTLAGLAAANGPWLAARVERLAELAGLSLPGEVVRGVVDGTSRVFTQILAAEGRPSANVDEAVDPAVLLGREQALVHREAGLAMPDSLRVQRLLRRAYDDLVRESWVEKDSRSRAHEDVERFFERALIGLAETWTGQTPLETPLATSSGAEDQAALLARREDELRRTLDAAKKLTQLVRQYKERAAGLEADLAQAREKYVARLSALKAEFADAHDAALAQARAEAEVEIQSQRERLGGQITALEAERSRMEDALTAQDGSDRRLAREELEAVRAEAAHGRAEVDRANAEIARSAGEARTLRAQLEAEAKNAEALRDELRRIKEDRTALASDAEAMRMRLAETGSRLAEVKRADGESLHERLSHAEAALALEKERSAALEAAARQAAEVNERDLRALSDSLDEVRELLARQAEQVAALEAERDALAERLRQLESDAK